MKIATFNINGIRARLPLLITWLKDCNPDVVALQETKCADGSFPVSELEDCGYNVINFGQKSFNGVAILSKHPIDDFQFGLPGNEEDEQARWIEASIKSFRICGLYLPNGNPMSTEKFFYKLEWMERLLQRARNLIKNEERSILLGDFNVIPQEEDAANPDLWINDALFHIKSRTAFRKVVNLGYTDAVKMVVSEPKVYTFWDYQSGSWKKNNGIRIDHILLSPHVADFLEDCGIDQYMRAQERPSDHVPVWIKVLN